MKKEDPPRHFSDKKLKKTLYLKDKQLQSDAHYEELIQVHHLQRKLPCLSQVKKTRKEVKKIVSSRLKFNSSSDSRYLAAIVGATESLTFTLEVDLARRRRCKKFRHEDSKKKKYTPFASSPPKKIKLKITLDERKVGNLKQLLVDYIPLNLDTFRVHSPDSIIPLLIVNAKEGVDVLDSTASQLKEELRKLSRDGLTIKTDDGDEVKYKIEFYFCSDMKSLWTICKDLEFVLSFVLF